MHVDILETWNIGKSEDLYSIKNWGKGYVGINERGNLTVHPTKDPSKAVDLKELVDRIRGLNLHAPLLLRFTDILKHRLEELAQAFERARRDNNYTGGYKLVYPIKVNQQRHVVEEIHRFGKKLGFGLEAGSKPELLAVIALVKDQETPIVCNGFKDSEYLEAVVLARKIGKNIIPIIEKFSELQVLLRHADKHGVCPDIGLRAKLATRGSGKWESSGGQWSKFGLTVSEMLRAVDLLKERQMVDKLKLLHFHVGSQVTNIRKIKEAINEAARIYVELRKCGANLEMLDVGGGLGIDYDGSQTNFGSSVNYTLEEYASDVTHGIQTVCDENEQPHPTILTESGRAVAAYQSVLVFNVLGVSEQAGQPVGPKPENADELPAPINYLYDTLNDLTEKNAVEMYHDAVKYYDDSIHLFKLGYLTLQDRDLAERLFWTCCREIYKISQRMPYMPEELEPLEPMLADTYFCNYSLFQSMPDSWAVQQLFPIVPIHRLNERPDRRATLADITCDSDGKVDRFIDLRDVKKVLELHSPNGSDYYLAAFLVGAYQEILGDLHNLFGDTHAVHIRLDANGDPRIETVVEGDTVREVLHYVQFSAAELFASLRDDIKRAIEHGQLEDKDAAEILSFYKGRLDSYTYLD